MSQVRVWNAKIEKENRHAPKRKNETKKQVTCLKQKKAQAKLKNEIK
jgi:hypothetical protein